MGQSNTFWRKFYVIQLLIGLVTPILLNLESLDEAQLAAIVKLRELVTKSDLVVADYMKEDYYLAKWLAFKDFDVDTTFQVIKENLAWRKQEKMDTILEENWDDMRKRFPYRTDSRDKSGAPVIYIDYKDWDMAGYLAEDGTASAKRYLRYAAMFGEEADAQVRRLRAQGENVTQFSLLSNMAGYSVFKHACIQCLWMYRKICNGVAPHYLPSLNKITVVNSPLIIRGVFALFSLVVQENFVIYGQDRLQWEPMLLGRMDRNQIPAKLLEIAELHEKDNSEGWLPWKFEL